MGCDRHSTSHRSLPHRALPSGTIHSELSPAARSTPSSPQRYDPHRALPSGTIHTELSPAVRSTLSSPQRHDPLRALPSGTIHTELSPAVRSTPSSPQRYNPHRALPSGTIHSELSPAVRSTPSSPQRPDPLRALPSGTIHSELSPALSAAMGQRSSRPKLYPGDILEFPRNKHFSHFGIYYGERDGVPYVAHLTARDSDAKIILFGRALKSSIKLDPIDLVGKRYKVSNYLDDTHTPRDFLHLIKPEIDEAMGKTFTYDILFHNCEHQAMLYRYGLKKSQQIEKIYGQIYPTWKELFEQKKL
ncbi:hypothetical protein AGOR_G00101100 [Albula goreensis]|uniref:LRAT domain-containing protein n=1 Tax=Albula goreensis TaxID=1534307 RepID=A0A8T3DIV1_9TELE|nr:hypothetical protein AGOR_G00101100 [Albula goreensis]